MSKALSFLTGVWCCYCAMIGSYGGAIVLLLAFVLIGFDPLNPNKKDASTGDADVQSK
ncbi:hypothetical protein [Limosilactobacillus galli]|uniref:hypothetical protein n=1 Tax=Limosilactobacillus galli TaxID=2991834 RepID=UPI0024BAC9E3|nr:hypothetical protein [Limosilactobacillus galli]